MPDHRDTLEAAARSFIDALRARDFPGIAACFASDARVRMLLPGGLERCDGRDAVAGQFAQWFASVAPFEIIESDTSVIVDRFYFAYRARLGRSDDSASLEVIEQHGFGDATPEGIQALDLVCSGFRPLGVSQSRVQLFDAGSMGCTDGLAPEFKRRIQAIPEGAILRVIVRDPAAKEDLPPLARMLGHTIQSVDTLEDGRVQIDVERAP